MPKYRGENSLEERKKKISVAEKQRTPTVQKVGYRKGKAKSR